jgi:hypothetical protein
MTTTQRYLHPAVERELASPASNGGRHNQILRVLPCLVGDGWTQEELFALLRARYPADFPDAEIVQLIDWGLNHNFEPSRSNTGQQNGAYREYKLKREPPRLAPLTPEQRQQRAKAKRRAWIQNTLDWLQGFRADEADLWERSALRPPDDIADDAEVMFRNLYGRGELVNVCPDYFLRRDKAFPHGGGLTKSATEWIRYLQTEPVPQSDAGCWFRINPVKDRHGSGQAGSYTDTDIAIFRWHLLESDVLPLELQLALWARLRLPIGLILDSGGRSYHALVKSYARSLAAYRKESKYLVAKLERFGLDSGNKNPSRFSRLPGAYRSIGARKDAELPGSSQIAQRILFLNPQPRKGQAIF